MSQRQNAINSPSLLHKILYMYLRIINPLIKSILRSPFHKLLSKNIMIVTFTGRKSGRVYTTPVSYIDEDGYITFATPHYCTWWKNLINNKEIILIVKGMIFRGNAEITVSDIKTIKEGIIRIIQLVPRDAKYYPIGFDAKGEPDPDELLQAAQSHVLVRVKIISQNMIKE